MTDATTPPGGIPLGPGPALAGAKTTEELIKAELGASPKFSTPEQITAWQDAHLTAQQSTFDGLFALVQKATSTGLTSWQVKAMIAGFLLPFVNQGLGKLGVQASQDEIIWAEGSIIAFIGGQSWVKASLHKLAAELSSFGLEAMGKAIESLAGGQS